MKSLVMNTPLGALCLTENGRALCSAAFNESNADGDVGETPLLLEARAQIDAYFAGERTAFDLPLAFEGTAFETAVWRALLDIPYGQTRTYGQIAAAVGKPGAARAVGQACNRNPLLLFVPCHRVVGRGGRLTGFAAGIERKRALLALEKQHEPEI